MRTQRNAETGKGTADYTDIADFNAKMQWRRASDKIALDLTPAEDPARAATAGSCEAESRDLNSTCDKAKHNQSPMSQVWSINDTRCA